MKIYQALKTAFDLMSKHFEVRQKYSAKRRIFNSLLRVWKRGQTRYFEFEISIDKLEFGAIYTVYLATSFYFFPLDSDKAYDA